MSRKSGRAQSGRTEATAPTAPDDEVTSEEALKFIRRMQKAFPGTPRTKHDRERLRAYLAQFSDRLLKAVGRRVQSDLLQRRPEAVHARAVSKPRSGTVTRNRNR